MRKNKNKSFRNSIVEALELPKDLVYHAALVNITGNHELLLENYKGIIEYEKERICIQAKGCRITISGRNLTIAYYTNEEMKITGIIQHVEYE